MDIAKIKERLSKITPGKWRYCGASWPGKEAERLSDKFFCDKERLMEDRVCSCGTISSDIDCFVAQCLKFEPDNLEALDPAPNDETFAANVRFIASAPSDIAALLAEVEKRDKVIEAAMRLLAESKFACSYASDVSTWYLYDEDVDNLGAALAELDKEAAGEQD